MKGTKDKKQMWRYEKSPVKSALGLIVWRIRYTFVMFLVTAFLIGVGFAIGLVLIDSIRTGGL